MRENVSRAEEKRMADWQKALQICGKGTKSRKRRTLVVGKKSNGEYRIAPLFLRPMTKVYLIINGPSKPEAHEKSSDLLNAYENSKTCPTATISKTARVGVVAFAPRRRNVCRSTAFSNHSFFWLSRPHDLYDPG